MKNKNVTILDYGSGNLLSVKRAFEHCGANVKISNIYKDIISSERLVIPGVGAFKAGMDSIKSLNLIDPLKKFYSNQRPLLGICLGMQLLSTKSFEFGVNEGLDFISGKVTKINTRSTDNVELKIPHIGWAKIMFKDTKKENYYYMCHSYQFLPNNFKNISATCFYGGHEIVASISHNNIIGFQFHPEKSADPGLELLDKFLKM